MAHAHAIRENPGQIMGIAALSATIGAITAMLFTPRTGEQVRHGIGRRARHGKDAVIDKMQSKKEDITMAADDIKDAAMDKEAEMAEKTADKIKQKTDQK